MGIQSEPSEKTAERLRDALRKIDEHLESVEMLLEVTSTRVDDLEESVRCLIKDMDTVYDNLPEPKGEDVIP